MWAKLNRKVAQRKATFKTEIKETLKSCVKGIRMNEWRRPEVERSIIELAVCYSSCRVGSRLAEQDAADELSDTEICSSEVSVGS
jgi:hypothetical protein